PRPAYTCFRSMCLLHPMPSPPPHSTLFPYTTLFRSPAAGGLGGQQLLAGVGDDRLEVAVDVGVPADLGDDLVGGLRDPPIGLAEDRKSTRLNSSHVKISYAVFCLKKKKVRRTTYRAS